MIRTPSGFRPVLSTICFLGAGVLATGCDTGGTPTPGGGPDAGSTGTGGATPGGSGGQPGSGGGVQPGSGGSTPAGTGGAPVTPDGGPTPTPGGTTVVVAMAAGLNRPTDLKFNPYATDELWVTNRGDNSMVIVKGATTSERMPQKRRDSARSHFFDQPTALAFGDKPTTIMDAQGQPVIGTFASCGESRNGGDDFMGPVLWTPDLRIFAVNKADRVPPFNGPMAGGLGSHLDMLHLSPLCTGIAWEGAGNVYWTFSGISKAFVRYDFREDHWIGNDNHTNGAEWRYTVPGQLGYVAGVPSHMTYVVDEKMLYFADTGNGRIVKFEPATATTMAMMRNPDGLRTGPSLEMSGGKLTDVVPKGETLEKPSGLEVRGQFMYVTDNARSTILKFTRAGALQKMVKVDGVMAGSLAGLTLGPDEKIYFVDMVGSRVLRLEDKL